jgi:hypothetical protein
MGVPVRGTAADLGRLIRSQRIEELIISTQSVNGNVEKQIRSVCEEAGVRVRRLHLEIR